MTILLATAALLAGLVILVGAADLFVGAAEGLALLLRWSPAVIGAVVVGFGTSLPELVTSAVAALDGQPDLAIGNAAGSNVANLLLILGVAVLVAPLKGPGTGPGRDIAIAAGSGLLLIVLASSGELGLSDGLLLLVVLAGTVAWQVASAHGGSLEVPVQAARGRLLVRIVLGLGGVIVGARLLVWGAIEIAVELGVPAIVIGSVLVAIGTSLPELATAVASARRGQRELLIGNLIGSNTFNALGVVGVAALVGVARDDVIVVDRAAMAVVVAAGVVTAGLGVLLWRRPRVGRVLGGVLVVIYVASVPLLLAVS